MPLVDADERARKLTFLPGLLDSFGVSDLNSPADVDRAIHQWDMAWPTDSGLTSSRQAQGSSAFCSSSQREPDHVISRKPDTESRCPAHPSSATYTIDLYQRAVPTDMDTGQPGDRAVSPSRSEPS